jgi:hypothetical protein
MKQIGLVGVLMVGLVTVVGCGSSDGGGSDAKSTGSKSSAARARFASGPTASLTKENGLRVLTETKRQQASGGEAMKGNPLGGGSGGTQTRSLGIRSVGVLAGGADTSGDAASTCADIAADKEKGTCACPGGGKLAYDVPNLKALKQASTGSLPEEIDIAFTYDACVMDTTKYDGSLAMLLSKKSVVKVDSKSDAPAGAASEGMNMLIVANDLVIGSEKLDFAFALDGGRFFYAPSVDEKGGYVLSELSFTGETRVHAKNGTYECKADACTSEDGKDTIPIAGGGSSSSSGSSSGGGASDGF